MIDKTTEHLNDKMDLLIRLIATQIIENKEYREQVKILSKVGLKSKDIADLTGKSLNNVKVTMHLIRKKEGGTKNE